MSLRLKGGFRTEDPRLDRLPQFDPRSWDFPVRETIEHTTSRSYTWPCAYYLDQGREGACTGFAVAHEIGANPASWQVSDGLGQNIYHRARQIDEWPGEDYSGSSVLAATKTGAEMGYYSEYRWAFGIDDLIMAVGRKGPAVLGINWYEGMGNPDSAGFIHKSGSLQGGHAIMCRGVNLAGRYFTLHNSWGRSWGHNSTAFITFEDMEALLHEDGEAVIPTRLKRKSA